MDRRHSERTYFLFIFFFLIFAVLFLRGFFLQVVKGQYYKALSDQNRTKTIIIHAPRGIITDRSGNPLVYNTPGFREIVNKKTIQLTQNEALNKLSKNSNSLEIDSLRQYPYGEAFAHVLGYIGQISEDELKSPLFAEYNGNDLVGKEGIEAAYEQRLKGIDGKKLLEIDATGKTVRSLGEDAPISGENLKLTLDLKVQQSAFKAMAGVKKGAAIVSNPKGEILALVSKPSFDPNLFTMGPDYKRATSSGYQDVSSILTDSSNQPLLDRAISGVYPPGSTFKIVVASAALKDKAIDENYQVEDTGILHVGDFSFSNWYYTGYGRTDGMVDVVKGIKRSNDIFFYKLAELLGVDKVSQAAASFDIGKTLGIDLPGEAAGILPTTEWKEKNIGETWYLGDTYHYGIGQGYLLTTPLQVNAWTQAIANGGTLYRPHLLLEKEDEAIAKNLLDKKSFDLVRQGMIEACQTGGVAWPFFNFSVSNSRLPIDGKNFLSIPASSGSADMRQVSVACKTGTAEHGDANTQPHAWITLFAPAFNPQIVVTVLSEESGEGSNVAGPIAKEIVQDYFSKLNN